MQCWCTPITTTPTPTLKPETSTSSPVTIKPTPTIPKVTTTKPTTSGSPTTTATPSTTAAPTTIAPTSIVSPSITPTAAPSTSNKFSADEIAAIVDAHNKLRSAVGITEMMSWSTAVEDFAISYAQQCVSGGALMAHNSNRYLADKTYVGENIFASTSSAVLSGVDAVSSWGSEKLYYNYTTNSCQSNKQCGHYTQIVWRSSLKVGCARVKCSNISYGNTILCDYSPGGNYVGQKPY
ncbi:pathogenesis-related protein 1 [Acrasis kona]|uniref:Pathogenesis-related protein 1 n=1 Tax=Acrasis kona TaxID=1008807 RepID=A0AAW2YRJ9_9EUKA